MDEIIAKALNEELTRERQNAAVYDALSAQADVINWPGLCAWMKRAANDERSHAQGFTDYLVDRNQTPAFDGIAPYSVLPADNHRPFFEAALVTEQATTAAINEIYDMAQQAQDWDTCRFLLPYLEEQTKSEREIVDYLKMLSRQIDPLVFDQSLAE